MCFPSNIITVCRKGFLFHRLKSFCLCVLCSSPEHSFSSETVWVGTPPVYLSACLLRCMLSSQQPPAPVYMSQAFVYWSVLDGLLFMSNLWCTFLFPSVALGRNMFGFLVRAQNWKGDAQIWKLTLTVDVTDDEQRHLISWFLFISLVRFPEEILCLC